jgi:hypothetical protein
MMNGIIRIRDKKALKRLSFLSLPVSCYKRNKRNNKLPTIYTSEGNKMKTTTMAVERSEE